MSNPARVLHYIYTDWRKRLNAQPSTMAKIVSPETPAGAKQLAECARALVRIDEILTALERDGRYRVHVFRRQYPEWWKGLIAYTGGWGTNIRGDSVMTEAHMDEIESFASFLEGKVWEIDGGQTANLIDVLRQARELLETDDEMSPELRTYIHRLLQQIQNALDDDTMGSTFDYGDAVMRLFVAFKAAEGEQTSKSSLWENLKASILPASGIAAAIEGGSILVQKALGM